MTKTANRRFLEDTMTTTITTTADQWADALDAACRDQSVSAVVSWAHADGAVCGISIDSEADDYDGRQLTSADGMWTVRYEQSTGYWFSVTPGTSEDRSMPAVEDDAPFDAAMAAVVRYLTVIRTGEGWVWPGPTKPPAADIDLAVERGYVTRRVVDFHDGPSTLYTEVTTTGEHMFRHYA